MGCPVPAWQAINLTVISQQFARRLSATFSAGIRLPARALATVDGGCRRVKQRDISRGRHLHSMRLVPLPFRDTMPLQLTKTNHVTLLQDAGWEPEWLLFLDLSRESAQGQRGRCVVCNGDETGDNDDKTW